MEQWYIDTGCLIVAGVGGIIFIIGVILLMIDDINRRHFWLALGTTVTGALVAIAGVLVALALKTTF